MAVFFSSRKLVAAVTLACVFSGELKAQDYVIEHAGKPGSANKPSSNTHANKKLSTESVLSSGTLFASYAKIPLVEGHGSYFEKSILLQDPVTKKEFDHADSVLEILSNDYDQSKYQCANIAIGFKVETAEDKGAPSKAVCSESDFLVKVWPSAKNEAKSYSCHCVSKITYKERGEAAEKLRTFPKVRKGQQLSLVNMEQDFTVYRPDGSWVEPRRLEGVYGQDLGPGPVDMNTGTRMRNMRFFLKNSRGEFVPLSKSQDLIYQVVDSGLVSSDVPATELAKRGLLKRADGSKVGVDRVSSDMWFRPKLVDVATGADLLGPMLHSNKNNEQERFNEITYAMGIDANEESFGLMSRMRSPERQIKNDVAKVAVEPEPTQTQVITTGVAPVMAASLAVARPTPSAEINSSLPIVSTMNRARQLGYYTHTYDDNFVWGRPHVVWNVQEAARRLAAKGMVMGIGDMNRKPSPRKNRKDTPSYAWTPGHASHNYGLAIDMRLMFSDGVARQGTYKSQGYDARKTFEMIKTLIEVDPTNVAEIRFNDETVLRWVRDYLKQRGIKGVTVKADSVFRKPMHHHHVHFAYRG